jgi:YfiR/HmsC-like
VKRVFLFVSVLLLGFAAVGQVDVKQAEAHIKAVYLYNFSKYIEWPTDYRQGDFVIGILNGSPAMIAELNKMAASKTAGSQKFTVKNYKTAAEIDRCNILYVPETSNTQLLDVLRKIKGLSTLLVTESVGDAKKGAAINFVLKESKQEFELNKGNAERCKLVVSSGLAALAIAKVD